MTYRISHRSTTCGTLATALRESANANTMSYAETVQPVAGQITVRYSVSAGLCSPGLGGTTIGVSKYRIATLPSVPGPESEWRHHA